MAFRRPLRRGIPPQPDAGGPARPRVSEEWPNPDTWDPAADSSLVAQTDLEPARWIEPLLAAGSFEVRMTVPQGFAAYARIFHPFVQTEFLGDDEFQEEFVTWTEVARQHGRTPHALMERETITGDDAGLEVADSMSPGQYAALLGILAQHTTSADGWFLCGPYDDASLRGYPQLELPLGRSYYLLRGPLGAYADFPDDPAYWWPEDRAWCVSTDIDFEWSYLAGSADCVAKVLATPAIDAFATQPGNPARASMDVINDPRP